MEDPYNPARSEDWRQQFPAHHLEALLETARMTPAVNQTAWLQVSIRQSKW